MKTRVVLLLMLITYSISLTLAQESSESYLRAMASDPETTRGEARLLHYLPEDMPIRVYVPTPEVENGERLRQETIRAFEAWQEAVPELIQFQFVDEPSEDALVVNWQALEPGKVGSYRYRFSVQPDNLYRFQASEILLDPAFVQADPYRYALLQVGHALGLLGRSPYQGDAMSNPPSGEISSRDIATLEALYALPSGMSIDD